MNKTYPQGLKGKRKKTMYRKKERKGNKRSSFV